MWTSRSWSAEGDRRRLEVGQDEVLGDESDDDARPAAGRLVGLGAVEDASVEQEALAGLEDHLRHAVRGADGRLGQAGAGLQFLDVVGRLEGLQVDDGLVAAADEPDAIVLGCLVDGHPGVDVREGTEAFGLIGVLVPLDTAGAGRLDPKGRAPEADLGAEHGLGERDQGGVRRQPAHLLVVEVGVVDGLDRIVGAVFGRHRRVDLLRLALLVDQLRNRLPEGSHLLGAHQGDRSEVPVRGEVLTVSGFLRVGDHGR